MNRTRVLYTVTAEVALIPTRLLKYKMIIIISKEITKKIIKIYTEKEY